MLQSCSFSGPKRKFDFSDETALPSLHYSIPNPHPHHIHLLHKSFFFKKEESSSLVCRAAEVQTAHFSFSEVWKWNIHDYRVLFFSTREKKTKKGNENSCHLDQVYIQISGVCSLIQDCCSLPAPVDSLNMRSRLSQKKLIFFLFIFETDGLLQFLFSVSCGPQAAVTSALLKISLRQEAKKTENILADKLKVNKMQKALKSVSCCIIGWCCMEDYKCFFKCCNQWISHWEVQREISAEKKLSGMKSRRLIF